MTRLDNARRIRAATGPELSAKSWLTEAPMRMLMNNLDPNVAERPEELVVYGGIGRAARDWESFDAIVATLKRLEDDQTLLVQSGKPVGVFRTHVDAPRVLIANSNLVPRWATWDHFNELDKKGLAMYGQMTAGSWIYIGAQGIVQGTYETFVEMGRQHYAGNLAGRWLLTAGLGGMGGAQPLAAVMAGASCLAIECQPSRIDMRIRTGYLDRATDSLDEALAIIERSCAEKKPVSVGLLGNAAEILPALFKRGVLLGELERIDEALAAYDRVLARDPDAFAARFERAGLHRASERDALVLGVCGGYQLLGHSYSLGGEEIEGVGLLDVHTVREEGARLIGNVAIEVALGEGGEPRVLAGFENHGGRTHLDGTQAPLGRVLRGHGNDGRSGLEGARSGNTIGTYLHGPLLPKNVWFADWLIARALGPDAAELVPLDDELERETHLSARRAAGV